MQDDFLLRQPVCQHPYRQTQVCVLYVISNGVKIINYCPYYTSTSPPINQCQQQQVLCITGEKGVIVFHEEHIVNTQQYNNNQIGD